MSLRSSDRSTRPLARLALAAALAVGLPACGPRQVQVTTGEAGPAASSIEVTNALPQAVNLYVRVPSGSELFLRQVPANSTTSVPVRGVAAGASVTLRAAPVDGSANITRENFTLSQGAAWKLP